MHEGGTHSYLLVIKGWTKKMEWKQSSVPGAGLGVFAGERIPAGTSYRILENNQNLIILNGPEDVPPLTESTKQFLADYCFQVDGTCYIMCPGSTLNHRDHP